MTVILDPNALAAPDTTPGASTAEPCLICQLKPPNPCDVAKLMLEVSDGKVTRKLQTTNAHRRREHVDLYDVEVRRMLRQDYDILIDIIADADALNFPDKNTAKIKGRAYYHGRSCSQQDHAELGLRPTELAPELAGKREIVVTSPGASSLDMPETAFFARRSFIDVVPNQASDNAFDEVTNVFGIVTMLWHMKDYRTVELVARSCGIRAMEDTQAANLNLRGAVRIFRNSKLTAGLAIPPLGSFKSEVKRDELLGPTRERETEATAGGNFYRSETKQTNSADGGISIVNERQRGGDVSQRIYEGRTRDGQTATTGYSERHRGNSSGDRSLGVITKDEVKDRLARAHGFDVVLTHNSTEVKMLDARNRLRDLIGDIGKALTDTQNIFKSAPQLGWKFTIEISVFAGSIVLEWFPEYVPDVQANGRYFAVQWKLLATFQIEVFNISVSASFGIDARAANSGLVVKVVGTLSGKASVAASIDLDSFKPREQIQVAGEASASLRAVGEVTLFGKTLADAELKGEGGIELVDGKLDVDWGKRTCDFTGKLESKPILITGYIRGIIWDSELDPVEVMERKSLYEFK